MSGIYLVKRIVNISLMALSFVLLLSATIAGATPIKPDVRKILAQPTPAVNQFVPARAGWNGPEMPTRADLANTTYDQFGPQGTARQVHQALFAAFIPDYRALGAVILIILLLRRMTTHRRRALAPAASGPGMSLEVMSGPVANENIPSNKAA